MVHTIFYKSSTILMLLFVLFSSLYLWEAVLSDGWSFKLALLVVCILVAIANLIIAYHSREHFLKKSEDGKS
ncbi:hypothetical protein FACS1894205_4580 [Alphaproteobacteria bacterium]|nr:hypothetical protein FACS1894205_4580 [Alphaproteobacteria bacterium]